VATKVTYKNLFQLVNDEIDKRVSYNTSSTYSNQLSRTSVSPSSTNSDVSAAELITAIQNLLSDALPNWIIEGLEVEATDPISDNIKINAGKGAVAGYLYELTEDINLRIPFDTSTEVFYITLYKDNIYIDRTLNSERLTIAKIVIPQPGTTSLIQDSKDESWNAYIVNFKEYKLYGHNDKFEEDTVELLRDNIAPILADNLMGNITLSEDLVITNTQGTMELDSAEMRLLGISGNTLAKFNRNGTFFYNDAGSEIAKFGVNEARIGNILITKNTIGSNNFVSEERGFRIEDNGYAEFEDVRVRGRISSSVFEQDKVSAVGGKIIVCNASVLAQNLLSTDTNIVVEDPVFSKNEVLYLQIGANKEYMIVEEDSSAPTYRVIRGLNRESGQSPYSWDKGTAIVSTGETGEGFITLDSVSQYNPFIDINIRNSSDYDDWSTKVRLGNLGGITDSDYGVLTGFGLYSDNVYLKGSLYSPTIKTSITGARIELTTSNFLVYDISENQVFKISISGNDSGDVVIGDTIEGNYLIWDNSEDKLSLCSSLIESGITKKVEIKDGCIVANEIQLVDPTCDCNYSYLDGGYLRFHDRLGDVPYVKRIANGTACTGDTICLVGWTTQPKVQVGIKSLLSYKAANAAQDQKWEVLSSTPVYFCTSPTNYGYCFNVYACLTLGEGTGAESVKDVNFETSACTAACVCATNVKSRFQLWCNNIAPSNYYYGTICYSLCYRKVGDATWCACCDSYVQPHGSSTELKTTCIDSYCLCFPCNATWEIADYCVSLGFTDSGICATGTCICCYQVTCCCCWSETCYCTALCNVNSCWVHCVPACHHSCTYNDYIGLTPPANTYCSLVNICSFVCLKTNTSTACSSATTYIYCGSWDSVFSKSVVGFGSCCDCLYSTCSYAYAVNCLRAYQTRCENSYSIMGATGCYAQIVGSVTYCYCCVYNCSCTYYVTCCCTVECGDAASCVYMNLYSLTDTYGCQCILDSTGCLNWLAISYS